jgi:hypothetical protein
VSLYPHKTAQALHIPSSQTAVNTALLLRHRQYQKKPISFALNFHAERSSPQPDDDLNISNYTMLNTFKLHPRIIRPVAARPNIFKLLSIVNSTLTKIQSKTWTHFTTLETLKHRSLGVSTTTTCSTADGKIYWHAGSAERFDCGGMGM